MKRKYILFVSILNATILFLAVYFNRPNLNIIVCLVFSILWPMLTYHALFFGRIITKQDGEIQRSTSPYLFWLLFSLFVAAYFLGLLAPWL